MSEPSQVPRTARDALIIELLSDVGLLHDDIKGIPLLLKDAMRDTLDIVADAVEDAEDTALLLQKSTNEVIQATAAKAGVDVGIEISTAVHQSLERVFEPALNRAVIKIENLESRISSLSSNVRDSQATRFNYIVLIGFVAVTTVMIGAMSWIAVKTQDMNDTNKWFYDEYKAQKDAINSLPPDLRRRFR